MGHVSRRCEDMNFLKLNLCEYKNFNGTRVVLNVGGCSRGWDFE